MTPGLCGAGAATAVGGVSQRIQDNARRHDNHLQLCRVQKMMRGQKTKVLAEGWCLRSHIPIFLITQTDLELPHRLNHQNSTEVPRVLSRYYYVKDSDQTSHKQQVSGKSYFYKNRNPATATVGIPLSIKINHN